MDRIKTMVLLIMSFVVLARNLSPYSLRQPHSQQSATSKQDDRGDTAGPYVLTMQDTDRSRKIAEIRSYLWQHWYGHRRGVLTEKSYSKEGLPTDTRFTIEQDQNGKWILRVASQRPPTPGSTPEHDHNEYVVYSIKRINRSPDLESDVPDEDVRSGETYRLVFCDESGKEIRRY
jgi:hypothetical protein